VVDRVHPRDHVPDLTGQLADHEQRSPAAERVAAPEQDDRRRAARAGGDRDDRLRCQQREQQPGEAEHLCLERDVAIEPHLITLSPWVGRRAPMDPILL